MKYTAGNPEDTGSKRMATCDEGPHRLAITSAEETTSSKGNGMIKMKLEVTGPKEGEPFAEGTGPVTFENLVFTPNAFWKIDQFRAAIGEEVVEGEEVDIEADELVGAVLLADLVKATTSKGKDCMEIAAFLTGDEPF